MTAPLCPFLLRRGRVICSTVREADSRPHRSCRDYRSSVPLCHYLRIRGRNGATFVNSAFYLAAMTEQAVMHCSSTARNSALAGEFEDRLERLGLGLLRCC